MKQLLHTIFWPKPRKAGALFEPKYALQIKNYLEENFWETYKNALAHSLDMNLLEHAGNQLYWDSVRIMFNIIKELSNGNPEEFEKFKYWIINNIDPIWYSIRDKLKQLWKNQWLYQKNRIWQKVKESQAEEVEMFRKVLLMKYKFNFMRYDFFYLYLFWKLNKGSALAQWKYMPTRFQNPDQMYFDFTKKVKLQWIQNLKQYCDSFSTLKTFVSKNWILPWVKWEDSSHEYRSNITFAHLWRHTATIWKDERWEHVSYRDIRDLHPPGSSLNINQYFHPFELYGRIYKNEYDAN